MIHSSIPPGQRGPVALSVGPETRAVATALRAALLGFGVEIVEFVADGQGFEVALRTGQFGSVIDLTLIDLAAELLGQPGAAGPDRLTGAALAGTPQVIIPGGCDQWAERPSDVERLAKDIAQKASASRGPSVIVVPTRSWSAGQELPAATADVFVAVLRLWLSPAVTLTVVDAGIGEPSFIDAVVAAWQGVTKA